MPASAAANDEAVDVDAGFEVDSKAGPDSAIASGSGVVVDDVAGEPTVTHAAKGSMKSPVPIRLAG